MAKYKKAKNPRFINYQEYLIETLKDPEEALAYLSAVLWDSSHDDSWSDKVLQMAIDDIKLTGGIVLEYKEYLGYAFFDVEAQIFHGQVVDSKDVITFQATRKAGLEKAFHDSVDDYLDWKTTTIKD